MNNEFPYKIPLGQLMAVIHSSTEILKVEVVGGWQENAPKSLTEDAFKEDDDNSCHSSETDRLLEYYANVPVWNVTTAWRDMYVGRGSALVAIIEARCSWEDVRDAYAREREDIRKAKRKAYRQRKKEEKENALCK